MALYDGFFDAVKDDDTGEYDRAYSSGDFTEYFGQFSGIELQHQRLVQQYHKRTVGGTI